MQKYTAPHPHYVNLNIAPDWIYRPQSSRGVNLNLETPYTAPSGNAVNFDFSPPTDGLKPSFNLELVTPDEPYLPSFDLALGVYVPPPVEVPTVIPVPFKTGWGRARPVDSMITRGGYEAANKIDVGFDSKHKINTPVDSGRKSRLIRLLRSTDTQRNIIREAKFTHADSVVKVDMTNQIKPTDTNYSSVRKEVFNHIGGYSLTPWSVPPSKDTNYQDIYNEVRWYGVDRIPIYAGATTIYTPSLDLQLESSGYIPNSNLELESLAADSAYLPYEKPDFDNVNFNLEGSYTPSAHNSVIKLPPSKTSLGNEGDIIGYEKTPIQPVSNNFETRFGFPRRVDKSQTLGFGFGINNFVVGGQWSDIYGGDTTPPVDPDEPVNHPDYGVYITVNIINIVVLPEETPLAFTNLKLSYDLDSFVWTADFDVATEADP